MFKQNPIQTLYQTDPPEYIKDFYLGLIKFILDKCVRGKWLYEKPRIAKEYLNNLNKPAQNYAKNGNNYKDIIRLQ